LSSIAIALQIYFKHIPKDTITKKPQPLLTILVGFFIGSLSSLLGIAGGEYSASFLDYYHFKIKKVTGTTAAIGLMISTSATIGFLLLGKDKDVLAHLPFSIGYIYVPAVIQICLTSLVMALIS